MKICGILPYGGTLRGFGNRLGVRVQQKLNPIRWAILDALSPEDDDDGYT